MTVAAALIVRDGEATLPTTLESVAGHIAETCLWIDDRTTDRTAEIAEGFGCRVEVGRFDGFDRAREASFRMVSDEIPWALWIDADEVVEGASNLGRVVQMAERYDAPYAFLEGEGADIGRRARVVHRERACWRGQVHEDVVAVGAWRGRPGIGVPAEIMRVGHRSEPRPPDHYLPVILDSTGDLDRNPLACFFAAQALASLGRDGEAAPHLARFLAERHDLAAAEFAWSRQAGLDLAARLFGERGRNDPCWCGSGVKFKKCHGA